MKVTDKTPLKKQLAPFGLKVCWSCERILGIDLFNKKTSTSDGLKTNCRECDNKEARADYHDNDKQRLAKSAEWRKNNPEKYRVCSLANANRIKAQYPERSIAQSRVKSALLSGAITKPNDCSCCGKTKRLDGHHHSYSEEHWTDVEWLCRKCHRAAHSKYGEV